MREKLTLLFAAVLVAALIPGIGRTEVCTPGADGCLPTPQECAQGNANGVTLGDEPGRIAVCVGVGGHVIAYGGGQVLGPCGDIVIADQGVASDPAFDPNECPHNSSGLPGSTWHEEYLSSADGTELHADIYRPEGLAGDVKTPIVLIVTPYANTGGTGDVGGFPPTPDFKPFGSQSNGAIFYETASIVPEIFARGYSLVVVGLRSFGASDGCDDFGGPKAQADVKSAVEWAASRAWSSGRVGMWGISAEGWTQMMALATHPVGLAAVVVQAPPIDRYAASYMNGVPYGVAASQNAFRYSYIDLTPPSLLSDPHQHRNWATGGVRSAGGCDERNIALSAFDDPEAAFWTERDLTARASGSDVPVLFSQGFLDSNVKPASFLAVWSTLTGPHRAWFGQYGHVSANSPDNPFSPAGLVGRGGYRDEALRWLDTYVKGIPASETGVLNDPPVEVERSDGQWRIEAQWPPADAQPSSFAIAAGAYVDMHGNSGEGSDPATACRNVSADGPSPCFRTLNGRGTWSFTAPFATPAHIAGVPSISVSLETLVPRANMIALVYDVDASGKATLLDRGAFLIRSAGANTVSFDLYPQDWYIAVGHRIGVLLSGSDDLWFNPVSTATPVRVLGGTLTLPMLPGPHASDLEGTLSQAGRERAPIQV